MGNICSGGSEAKKASALTSVESEDIHASFPKVAGGADGIHVDDGVSLNPNDPSSALAGGFHDMSEAAQLAASSSTALLSAAQNKQQQDLTAAKQLQIEKERLEQVRLQTIVQTAGRGMVAVQSVRGSNGYYDQGFAAALSQHLEQTTEFLPLTLRLPPAISQNTTASHTKTKKDKASSTTANSSVYARLSQAPWQGILLGLHHHSDNKAASSTNSVTTATIIASPNTDSSAATASSGSSGIVADATEAASGGLAACAGENPYTYMDHLAESYLERVVPKRERIFAGTAPVVENLL